MKALSIKSPWWEKIISGEKTIETRTWKTNYRGPIAICASKPKGAIVGFAYLINVHLMKINDVAAACCPWQPLTYAWVLTGVKAIKPIPIVGKLGLFEIDMPAKIDFIKKAGNIMDGDGWFN